MRASEVHPSSTGPSDLVCTRRERTKNLPLLQRFDDEATPPLPPEEIKQRWVEFHRRDPPDVGNPPPARSPVASSARTPGGTASPDSSSARRSSLAATGRKIEEKSGPLVSASKAPEIFPVNYRPRAIDYASELAALDFDCPTSPSSCSTRRRRPSEHGRRPQQHAQRNDCRVALPQRRVHSAESSAIHASAKLLAARDARGRRHLRRRSRSQSVRPDPEESGDRSTHAAQL